MRHYRLMILAVLLTLVGRAMADNLTVETVTLNAGDTKQVAIILNNPTHQYAAFQFDLVLPEGVSIAKNDKGKFIASLNEDRKDDHTLTVSEMGNNTYRFLTFSMTNAEFYGKNGALVYITLKADDGISGGNKTATIQSQVFTEVSGTQHKWDDTSFTVEIKGGGGSEQQETPAPGDDMLTVEAISMAAGDTKQLTIGLNNPTHQYAAFQFDLVLPNGVSIVKNDKGKFIACLNEDRKDDHTLTVSEMGNNTYRFLTFSMTNAEFYGKKGALVYVTLKADDGISAGDKIATILSQVFTEVSGTQHKWSDKNFTITISVNVKVTAPTAKNGLVYTGSAQELVSAGSTNIGTLRYSLDGSSYNTAIPKGTDAKTYTVYYKAVDSENKDLTTAGSLNVTISPKTVSSPTITLSPTSYVYDGKEKKPTVTVKDGNTTIPTSEYTVSYSNNVNVGTTATVTIKDKDGGNYIVNGSAKFTITKASASVKAPTAKSGLVYNGKAQELITAGSSADGTLKYSLDGKSYSTSIPKGTDAKSYTVYYKLEGDGNHKDTEPATLTATITKALLTVTAKSYTITQGDALPTFEATYSGFKNNETSSVLTSQPKFSCSVTSSSVPGTYDIIVSNAAATNYEINYVNGSLTVTAGTYTLKYIVNGVEYRSYQIKYGTTITPEAAPTKEGYTFSGWSEIPSTMPAKDLTVTGTFTINKYKLIYKVDGEEFRSFEIEYGTSITPIAAPTKDGYDFSGWDYVPETMPAHDVIVNASFTLGITDVMMDSGKVKVFDTMGNQIGKPKKGVNIIRTRDGKTKKVMVK